MALSARGPGPPLVLTAPGPDAPHTEPHMAPRVLVLHPPPAPGTPADWQRAAYAAEALLCLHHLRLGRGDTRVAVGACALLLQEAAVRGYTPEPPVRTRPSGRARPGPAGPLLPAGRPSRSLTPPGR